MPKKMEPEVRERVLRLLATHAGEYPSLTAACDVVPPKSWRVSYAASGLDLNSLIS